MRIPRDVSSKLLIKKLAILEYTATRQIGSHIRLTTQRGGEHHITIPNHKPIRVGTLSAILKQVADHHGVEKSQLVKDLFG